MAFLSAVRYRPGKLRVLCGTDGELVLLLDISERQNGTLAYKAGAQGGGYALLDLRTRDTVAGVLSVVDDALLHGASAHAQEEERVRRKRREGKGG